MTTIEKYIDLAAEMGSAISLWKGVIAPSFRLRLPTPKRAMFVSNCGFTSTSFWTLTPYRRNFPKYAKMGVTGLKIDFIDRNDQWAMNWSEDVAKVAAENHLLVDFPGAD